MRALPPAKLAPKPTPTRPSPTATPGPTPLPNRFSDDWERLIIDEYRYFVPLPPGWRPHFLRDGTMLVDGANSSMEIIPHPGDRSDIVRFKDQVREQVIAEYQRGEVRLNIVETSGGLDNFNVWSLTLCSPVGERKGKQKIHSIYGSIIHIFRVGHKDFGLELRGETPLERVNRKLPTVCGEAEDLLDPELWVAIELFKACPPRQGPKLNQETPEAPPSGRCE